MKDVSRNFEKSTRSARRPATALVETLEGRLLMAAQLAPNIVMDSISTLDSKSLTVAYEVHDHALNHPLDIGVYRSASSTAGAGSEALTTVSIPTGSLDAKGISATSVGLHQVTLALPDGLPPAPLHPYVVAVADPLHVQGESNTSDNSASFHTRVIGVITHGGMQPKGWSKSGPPWESRMASTLLSQGYDEVIAFNWAGVSRKPGNAARQAPRLASMIEDAAARFPSTDTVDLHLIGHSEGTVVNSLALTQVEANMPASLRRGYVEMTMIDPHAASNNVAGPQYSVSPGLLGWIAKGSIDKFQSQAKDPSAFVPASVDRADVFFQHTPVGKTYSSNNGMYNLWGQVPVKGVANYYNLTAPGISHAGTFGIQDWYQANVAPTLGDGAPRVEASTLSVRSLPSVTSPITTGDKATYTGAAAPGSTVTLRARPSGASANAIRLGRTVAGPSGAWSITTPNLAAGSYRVSVVSTIDSLRNPARQDPMKPIVWLPPLNVVGKG